MFQENSKNVPPHDTLSHNFLINCWYNRGYIFYQKRTPCRIFSTVKVHPVERHIPCILVCEQPPTGTQNVRAVGSSCWLGAIVLKTIENNRSNQCLWRSTIAFKITGGLEPYLPPPPLPTGLGLAGDSKKYQNFPIVLGWKFKGNGQVSMGNWRETEISISSLVNYGKCIHFPNKKCGEIWFLCLLGLSERPKGPKRGKDPVWKRLKGFQVWEVLQTSLLFASWEMLCQILTDVLLNIKPV